MKSHQRSHFLSNLRTGRRTCEVADGEEGAGGRLPSKLLPVFLLAPPPILWPLLPQRQVAVVTRRERGLAHNCVKVGKKKVFNSSVTLRQSQKSEDQSC